jgi:hypothetical protein
MDCDDYKNTLPYPEAPKKPDILRKSVGELTDEELKNVRGIKRQYEQAKIAYDEARKAYGKEDGRLYEKFYNDIRREFDIDPDLHSRIFAYAWDKGHSSGYHEVYQVYEEIVDVIKG